MKGLIHQLVTIAVAAAFFSGAGVWSLPAHAQPTGVSIYTDTELTDQPSRYQMASPDFPVPVTNVPGSGAAVGIVPEVSAALEKGHVLEPHNGNLYSAYASDLTGGITGNLLILDATTIPSDGAVAPKVCVPFDGTGKAQAHYSPGPPAVFANGIVAVVSSDPSCFVLTTSTLTAFFSGMSK
jgi:hypothetical protein